MSDNTVKRLRWRCRRGMRELDLILESYLEQHTHDMSDSELRVFERFLDSSDMDLYEWVTGRSRPADTAFAAIVAQLAVVRE